MSELQAAIKWLKNNYQAPKAPLYGTLSDTDLAFFNQQQRLVQDYTDYFKANNVEINSILPEPDTRTFNQKVKSLQPTDRITIPSDTGPTTVLYEPSSQDFRNAYWSTYGIDQATNAYSKLPPAKTYTDFIAKSLAQGRDLAGYAWANTPEQTQRSKTTGMSAIVAPTPAPLSQPATIIQNPPRQYNAGLANSSPAKPTNNPFLPQSTLADEDKWNRFYTMNEKTPIVTTNTEPQQFATNLGKKRQRDPENVVAAPLQTPEDATKNVESETQTKKMRTQPPPPPPPPPRLAPRPQPTPEQERLALDQYTQAMLRLDASCEDLRPLAVRLRKYFNNDEKQIEAYLTQQVLKKFPITLSWTQKSSVMGGKILSCIQEEKALQEQQQKQRQQAQQKQTTFAPEPAKAPESVQPTAQAGDKQIFADVRPQVTPVSQSAPDILLAEDEVLVNYNTTTTVQWTAPIDDTRTQNAETAQEASKIQNAASEQQRVPEKAVRTTGGVDVNIARPNNLVNEPQPGVETTTANESLRRPDPVAQQQRTPDHEDEQKWRKINTTVGVFLMGSAAFYALK